MDKPGKPFLVALFAGALLLIECIAFYPIASAGVDYEFINYYGEYKLLRRNNDLYREKLDGSETKRVTYTPDSHEEGAFILEGKYILMAETQPDKVTLKYFVIPSEEDDTKKKEISTDEYYQFLYHK